VERTGTKRNVFRPRSAFTAFSFITYSSEQGAEENIWTEEGERDSRLENTA
jgi:hypothetical protein